MRRPQRVLNQAINSDLSASTATIGGRNVTDHDLQVRDGLSAISFATCEYWPLIWCSYHFLSICSFHSVLLRKAFVSSQLTESFLILSLKMITWRLRFKNWRKQSKSFTLSLHGFRFHGFTDDTVKEIFHDMMIWLWRILQCPSQSLVLVPALKIKDGAGYEKRSNTIIVVHMN